MVTSGLGKRDISNGRYLTTHVFRVSPPVTRLPSRSWRPSVVPYKPEAPHAQTCVTVTVTRRSPSPPECRTPPTNMYLGENFAVMLKQQCFKLHQLVHDTDQSGLVHTAFDPFKRMRRMSLSAQAQRMRDEPNAGGSSVVSEVLSYELLSRCFNARLIKTEMEVEYFPEGGSITDYVCEMFDCTLGVSVTRAMSYGPHATFTPEHAQHLLNKKLRGVIQSSRNTLVRWTKQILHVWAQDKRTADIVTRVFNNMDNTVRTNTIVIVTTAATCEEIFTN